MKNEFDLSYAERKCYQCGKIFIVHDADEWVYKRTYYGNRRFFCTWSCLKAYDERYDKVSKRERREQVVEALKKGVPVSKVVERYGADYAMVRYWKKKLEQEQVEPEDESLLVQGY